MPTIRHALSRALSQFRCNMRRLKITVLARQLTAGVLALILIFSSTPPALAHFAASQVMGNSFGYADVSDVTSKILRLLSVTQDSSMPPSERPLPPSVELRRPPTKGEREGKVHHVEVNPQGEVWLESGQPMNFTAVPLDLDGNAIHGLVAEWESSDRQVVFITHDGQAVAGKPGKAKLTASVANKKEKVDVMVTGGGKLKFGGRKDSRVALSHDNGDARIINARWSPDEGDALFQTTRRPGRVKFVNAAVTLNDPYDLPDAESPSMYSPRNVVGTPPGRTTPGAATPATATNGTEMPGSSNFSFGVPVASLPGRGIDVAIGMVYNSLLWNESQDGFGQTVMTYDVDNGWPAPGFRLGYGQIEDRGVNGFTLTDHNGTRRQLRKVVPTNQYDYNYEATDGTFIKFYGGRGWGTATYTDGTSVQYGAAGSGVISYPTRITDRNGNYILINYVGGVGPKLSTVQDTLGRYVRFYYDASSNLVTITAPGYANGAERQTLRLYYQDITISGTFQSPIVKRSPATARVVRYVYFPGTQTGFRYDYSAYGMIRQMAQLRAMSVSTTATTDTGSVTNEGQTAATTLYNYPETSTNLTSAPAYTRRTDDWAGRTANMPGEAGAPYYSFAVDRATGTSTVTSPDGTITETKTYVPVGAWFDGLVEQIIVKKADGTVLNKSKVAWEPGPGNSPRLKKIWTTNDANQTRAIVHTYTSYNNISVVSERDFAAEGTEGVELRRTETTYETGTAWTSRGLVRLPASVKVFAGGSSTPASRVDYAYDTAGTNLTARSAIVMHDPAFNPYAPQQESCLSEPDYNDPDYYSPGCYTYDPSCDGYVQENWVCNTYSAYNPATDKRGNVTQVTKYANAAAGTGAITDTINYDIAGNIVSESVDCCQLKSFSYDSTFYYAYQTSETRGATNQGAPQLPRHATYDFNTGLLRTTTDENIQLTVIDYYPGSLRHLSTSSPGGGYTLKEYGDGLYDDPDPAHRHSWVKTTTRVTTAGATVDNWQFLDGRGAVARTFGTTTGTGRSTIDIEYDVVGRVRRVSNPYYSTGANNPVTPNGGLWTTSGYDQLDRIVWTSTPDGNEALNQNVARVAYAGAIITITDQAGKQRRQKRDALGRVVRVDEPDGTGNLGTVEAPAQHTSYDYDALNNLLRSTQGQQQRFFKYDSLSRLTHERHVEQAAPHTTTDGVFGNAAWSRRYAYNSHNLISDSWDARNINTHFAYDGLNRVKEVAYSDGVTPTVKYSYDENRPNYNQNISRLTGVETLSGGVRQTFVSYDYDAAGRVARNIQTVGGTSYQLLYSYNPAGQLTSETYPTGRTVSYNYDTAARLASVADASRTYLNNFTYGAHGGLTSETYGNGAVHQQGYNSRLQPNSITLTKNSTTLQHFAYEYGQVDQTSGTVDANKNNGRVARIDSFIGGTTDVNRQWQQRFSYDSLGRLEVFGEYATTGTQTPIYRGHYGYDRFGNRYQSATQTLNLNVSYTPVTTSDIDTATNRLITSGGSPITYDSAGNVTVDNRFRQMQYVYDANNRMLSSNRGDGSSYASSVYDGGGQRVQTTSYGYIRTFIYDAFGLVVAEYGNNTLEREYVYKEGQAVASIEAAAACYKTVEQFIRDFYQGALGRAVNEQTELPYWKDRLTRAQAQGQAQLLSEAKALGDTIFSPNEQTYRARTNSEFVADLYRGYLQREPDQGGWTAWMNALQTNTRAVVRAGFLNSSEFANNVRRLCVSVPASGVRYLTADFQGSVRVVTNEQGAVVARHDYQPFGEEVWAGMGSRTGQQGYGATDQVRERYALTQRDDNTGMEHTWWRKYERGGGRWTSPDPDLSSMSLADPQSFNRYSYVQNDPINFADPTGLNFAPFITSICQNGDCSYVLYYVWIDGFGAGPTAGGGTMSTGGGGSDRKIHGNIPKCPPFFLMNDRETKKQFCKRTGNVIQRLVDSITDRFTDPKFKSDDPGFPGHRDRIEEERRNLEKCRQTFDNNCDDSDLPPGVKQQDIKHALKRTYPGTKGTRDAYRRGAFDPIIAAGVIIGGAVTAPARIGGRIIQLVLKPVW